MTVLLVDFYCDVYMFCLNYNLGTWTLFDSMSHRRSEHAMANVDGHLLVFGGYQVNQASCHSHRINRVL